MNAITTLDKLLGEMELVISAAQLVDNTNEEARMVREELYADMRTLIRQAYRAGRDEALASLVTVQEKML